MFDEALNIRASSSAAMLVSSMLRSIPWEQFLLV
jgi:hypothetical protein